MTHSPRDAVIERSQQNTYITVVHSRGNKVPCRRVRPIKTGREASEGRSQEAVSAACKVHFMLVSWEPFRSVKMICSGRELTVDH